MSRALAAAFIIFVDLKKTPQRYKHFTTLCNNMTIGKVVQFFEELSSTNDVAIQWLAKSPPIDGTVIMAASQTAGRGQANSVWESAPHQNLTLSVILYPYFLAVAEQFLLSQAMAIAVRDFVQLFLPDKKVTVKWANDVWVGDKKIAGILIQNQLLGSRWQSAVVGIGININQKKFAQLGLNATSLSVEEEDVFDLSEIQSYLFQQLDLRYAQLQAGKTNQIRADYAKNLYKKDVLSSFFHQKKQAVFQGTIVGTTDAGYLEMKIDDTIQFFETKEIIFL